MSALADEQELGMCSVRLLHPGTCRSNPGESCDSFEAKAASPDFQPSLSAHWLPL